MFNWFHLPNLVYFGFFVSFNIKTADFICPISYISTFRQYLLTLKQQLDKRKQVFRSIESHYDDFDYSKLGKLNMQEIPKNFFTIETLQ